VSTPEPCAQGTGARPSVEVADILRAHLRGYSDGYDPPAQVRKTLAALAACRTARLGGHLERCSHCGFERPAYNSCRNRHCPKCQGRERFRWLEKRKAELLPTPYFHLVFTLPHALNRLILANQKALLSLLFQAVFETLEGFGRSRLGGRMGGLAVLHTWDQQLRDHFHLHCLVPGGALAQDRSAWRPAPQRFLFPVRALSRVFRALFLGGLAKLFDHHRLSFPPQLAALQKRSRFRAWLGALAARDWVVFAKAPFASPALTLEYLGRYTHRVAISNRRLVRFEAGRVCFTYRDRAAGSSARAEVDALEFIRRFALHILPKGFVRIRGFGFLSNRSKKSSLARCRELLPAPATAEVRRADRETAGQDGPLPSSARLCPQCSQGTMWTIRALAPEPPASSAPDARSPPSLPRL
jgi:hypothetical protein